MCSSSSQTPPNCGMGQRVISASILSIFRGHVPNCLAARLAEPSAKHPHNRLRRPASRRATAIMSAVLVTLSAPAGAAPPVQLLGLREREIETLRAAIRERGMPELLEM